MREHINELYQEIRELEQKIEFARLKIKHLRQQCPHLNVKKWTNNDGDGQFTVHRCLDCDLQKDGPL